MYMSFLTPEPFLSKLQSTYHFPPGYLSLQMLHLPEFSDLCGRCGKLALHALRVSLLIAVVLEKALRSQDLVMYKKKEGT